MIIIESNQVFSNLEFISKWNAGLEYNLLSQKESREATVKEAMVALPSMTRGNTASLLFCTNQVERC